jgi:hypothetical protein
MIDKLNNLSSIISLIQIVLGGFVFSLFKIWLLKEEELNKTIALRKERKYEEACELLQNVIERAFNEDISLRGDGGDHPDVVLSFTKKIIGVCNDFENLKRSKKIITDLNTFLIGTSLLGIIFLIVAQCINSHYYIISIASIFIIMCQIIVFIIIRLKGNELHKFEDL